MKPHTKIYLDALGYTDTCFIPCENTGQRAVDINHIECRGMGGNPTGDKDRIENLVALTRNEHLKIGDKSHLIAEQYVNHRIFLDENNVKYDNKYFEAQIKRYDV